MTATAPQLELDFQIGHARPWLKVSEIARALRVSEDHVCNLFDGAALDFVIDLKTDGARRPCYRILRASFERWQDSQRSSLPTQATDLEAALDPHLRTKPEVLLSTQIAWHLSASHDLVLDHAGAFFDASAPRSSRTFFRATQGQLLKFITDRRLT